MSDALLKKVHKESITEKVVTALRTAILSGTLKPGTRLIESELADQLGVPLLCAYAEMMRDHLATILADEVAEGSMSEERALDIARCLLRENGWVYFKLQDRWADRP